MECKQDEYIEQHPGNDEINIYNVDKGVLPIDGDTLEKLRPHKKTIHSLIAPKKSLKKRKQELVKQNHFQQLIGPLIPTLQNKL